MEPQATPALPTPPIPAPPTPEPIQPTPPPMPEPPDNKMSQKLLIPSIVLLVVAIILVAFKLILKNKVVTPPQPSPTASTQPSPTPDPTANWKTYTNTKYGYQLKYPPDWKIDSFQGSMNELNPTELSQSEYISLNKDGYPISVSANHSLMGKTVSCLNTISDPECLQQFFDDPSSKPKYQEYQIASLDQIPAIKYLEQPLDYPTVVFVKNKTLIKLTYAPDPHQNIQILVDQILSTFKFLELDGQDENCKVNYLYESNAVSPETCRCPSGYEKDIIETTWGLCPKTEIQDCPQIKFKCVEKK